MRRAGSKSDFMTGDSGELCGLTLAADYCAEHERGIAGILRKFRVPGTGGGILGVEARQITTLPDKMIHFDGKAGKAVLIFHRDLAGGYGVSSDDFVKHIKKSLRVSDEFPFTASWDEGGFAVAVKGREMRQKLAEIYAAMTRLDLTISIGGSDNPFDRGGLCLCIPSRFSSAFKDGVRSADEDYLCLLAAEKKTGVHEKLKAAGLRFYALSPKWAASFQTVVTPSEIQINGGAKTRNIALETSHPVVFFLNPVEQNSYDHGWFTVEELLLWCRGEGPIVKNKTADKKDPS